MRKQANGIAAVLFDLDGTLVRYQGIEYESSWGAIAAAAGVGDRSRALLREYMSRPEAYAEWVVRDAALLAGVDVREIEARVLPAPYAEGVREAARVLRGSYRLGIVSSGVDLVADWVCRDLGFDFAVANRLHVKAGRFAGTAETRVGLWAKDAAVRAVAAELGLSLGEICFVGDHVNDIPALRIVGLPVAANPKSAEVAAAAAFVVETFHGFAEKVATWRRGVDYSGLT